MVAGGVEERDVELVLGNPFGEEVGGHVLVADVLENDLALGDALLEREVAAEEVPRAGWAADAGADLLVGEVRLRLDSDAGYKSTD